MAALLAKGSSRAEISRDLGITKSTVSYHARRLGEALDQRCNRRYNWAEVQHYHDQGHSKRECQAAFGFAAQSWHEAVNRGVLVPRPQAMALEELLTGKRNRSHLKGRLLRLGIKASVCEACGISQWRDLPLSLALHHVNGDGRDNRLENLQLLCPNCHSQTENFAGRNRGRGSTSAGTPRKDSPYAATTRSPASPTVSSTRTSASAARRQEPRAL